MTVSPRLYLHHLALLEHLQPNLEHVCVLSFCLPGGGIVEKKEYRCEPERPVQHVREPSAEASPTCDPCLFFFYARRGCRRGSSCKYCHLDHDHGHRPAIRPRKQTRDRYKSNVLQLLQGQRDVEEVPRPANIRYICCSECCTMLYSLKYAFGEHLIRRVRISHGNKGF